MRAAPRYNDSQIPKKVPPPHAPLPVAGFFVGNGSGARGCIGQHRQPPRVVFGCPFLPLLANARTILSGATASEMPAGFCPLGCLCSGSQLACRLLSAPGPALRYGRLPRSARAAPARVHVSGRAACPLGRSRGRP